MKEIELNTVIKSVKNEEKKLDTPKEKGQKGENVEKSNTKLNVKAIDDSSTSSRDSSSSSDEESTSNITSNEKSKSNTKSKSKSNSVSPEGKKKSKKITSTV